MAISQTQSVSDLLSLGMKSNNNDKGNKVKGDAGQFGSTLKTFSSSYSNNFRASLGDVQSSPSPWGASGNNAPVGGKGLPETAAGLDTTGVSRSNSAMQKKELESPKDRQALKDELDKAGIDPQKLKDVVVSNGEVSEEEFDQLLDSPEDFLQQLDVWMQTPGLGQDIIALAERPMALQQLALIGRSLQGARAMNDGSVQLAQADLAGKKEPASDLVGRLLDERGEGNLEEGLSKDKLFEQLLNAKNADSGNKSNQFSMLMSGESLQPGKTLNTQSVVGGLAGAGQTATPLTQAVPQLPAMRGLPGQPGATEALSERIMMMRSKNMQIAEIKLNPQELGALEVRVKIVNDVASVQFHSPNPGVREALEGQIVRLREMLDGAGLSLGDVGVSDQSLSEGDEKSFAESVTSGSSVSGEDDGGLSHESASIGAIAQSRQALGVVDYFA